MFRGLTSKEHAVGLILAMVIIAGATLHHFRQQKSSTPLLEGPVIVHPEGELTSADATAKPGILSDAIQNGLVDVNKADAGVLELLPGIGPERAKAIVQYRETNGLYSRPEDIQHVPGIGPKTLAGLLPLITASNLQAEEIPSENIAPQVENFAVDLPEIPIDSPRRQNIAPSPVATSTIININTASIEELQTLDDIGPVLARRILENRQQFGRFGSIDALQRVYGIGPKTIEKNRHRLVAE